MLLLSYTYGCLLKVPQCSRCVSLCLYSSRFLDDVKLLEALVLIPAMASLHMLSWTWSKSHQ